MLVKIQSREYGRLTSTIVRPGLLSVVSNENGENGAFSINGGGVCGKFFPTF